MRPADATDAGDFPTTCHVGPNFTPCDPAELAPLLARNRATSAAAPVGDPDVEAIRGGYRAARR